MGELLAIPASLCANLSIASDLTAAENSRPTPLTRPPDYDNALLV